MASMTVTVLVKLRRPTVCKLMLILNCMSMSLLKGRVAQYVMKHCFITKIGDRPWA